MKIRSDSRSEQVARQILGDISSGILQPGDRLPNHQKLAEHYGVGRSSIREAINALAVMNRVVAIQGRGTFVKEVEETAGPETGGMGEELKSANLSNLMEIREVLECHAVKKAAEVISEEQIPVLEQALHGLEKSFGEVHLFLSADTAFHLAIAGAAKNPELGRIVKLLHGRVNEKMAVIFKTSLPHNVRKAISTAQDVVKYIVAGDGVRAVRCMREHLDVPKEAFLAVLFDDSASVSLTVPPEA